MDESSPHKIYNVWLFGELDHSVTIKAWSHWQNHGQNDVYQRHNTGISDGQIQITISFEWW